MLPDSILPTPEDDIARILASFEKRISHLERLEQGGLGLGARVFNSAAITLISGAATFITFDSERFDDDNIHDAAVNPGRLTARTAGIYQITANISWAPNVTGRRQLAFRINGATFIALVQQDAVGTAGRTLQEITTLYELSTDDFVEIRVLQTSGGNLDIQAVANFTPEFMMIKVG